MCERSLGFTSSGSSVSWHAMPWLTHFAGRKTCPGGSGGHLRGEKKRETIKEDLGNKIKRNGHILTIYKRVKVLHPWTP